MWFSRFIPKINKNFKLYKQLMTTNRKYGPFCLSLGITTKLSCDSRLKIQEPDVSQLSREFLIKSSSITTAQNAQILHTQTALALQQAEIEYREALLAVAYLLEFKLQVLGNQQEEARIWDLILEGRSLVNNTRKKRDDLDILLGRTGALLSIASEVTFMTGADIVGNTTGDHLYKLEKMIKEEKSKSKQAEEKLRETEVKVIHVEGKYADEHSEELEEEQQRLLNDLGASPKLTNGGENTQSEKNNQDLEVIDIIGTVGENLSDNTATEI